MTSYKDFMGGNVNHYYIETRLGRDELAKAWGFEVTQQMIDQLRLIRERMKQAQDWQKSYTD